MQPPDNPVRAEAESAAATGVANSATPTPQAGASNNAYRDWTAGPSNGNNVTFTLNAPAAGRYELRFRYAAAASAVRKISVGADLLSLREAFLT